MIIREGTGDVNISIGAGMVFDLAGNSNALLSDNNEIFTLDNEKPSLTITRNSPINGSLVEGTTDNSITFTLDVDEDLLDSTVQESSITLNDSAGFAGAATTSLVQVNDTSYTYTISGLTGDGAIGITLDTLLRDVAGNYLTNSGLSSDSILVDNSPPEVLSIERLPSFDSLTNVDSVGFRITFSEEVENFSENDITLNLNAASGEDFDSDNEVLVDSLNGIYDYYVTSLSGQGDLSITISSDNFNDLAGNDHSGSEESEVYHIDLINPELTVALDAPASDQGSISSTNADTLKFSLSFSENIDDDSLSIDDVTINTSDLVVGDSFIEIDGDSLNYNVVLADVTGSGTVSITVDSLVYDSAGNALLSDITSSAFTLDNDRPKMDSIVLVSPDESEGSISRTTASRLSFTLYLSEELEDGSFDASDITIGTDGMVTTSSSNFDVEDDTTYTFEVRGITGTGHLWISIDTTAQDAASNYLLDSGLVSDSFYIDNDIPTLTISLLDPTNGSVSGTNDDSVRFALSFSEEMDTTTFSDTDDLTLSIDDLDEASIDQSPLEWISLDSAILVVKNITGDNGQIELRVQSDIADLAGNELANDVTSDAFIIDNVFNGSVTIERESVTSGSFTGTSDDTLSYRIEFGEKIDDGTFDASDITVSNGTGESIESNWLTDDGDSLGYTYSLIIRDGSGDVNISIGAGMVFDLAGNSNASAINNAGEVFSLNNSPLEVSNVFGSESSNVSVAVTSTNADELSFTITFNESVDTLTFDTLDITISSDADVADAVTGLVLDKTENPKFVFSFSGVSGNGNIWITIDSAVSDLAGNQMLQDFISDSILVDNTAPSIFSVERLTDIDSLTNSDSVGYELIFSEPIQGLTASDIEVSLNSSGESFDSESNAISDPINDSTYQFYITEISGEGDISVSIEVGEYTDEVGNANISVSTLPEFHVDRIQPEISTLAARDPSSGSKQATTADTVYFDLQFSENIIDDSLTMDDLTVNAAIGLTYDTAYFEMNSDQAYTVVVAGLSGNGDIDITIDSLVYDSAENYLSAISTSDVITLDNNLPTIDSIVLRQATNGSIELGTNDNSVAFTIYFNEDIDANTISLENFTLDTTQSVTISGDTTLRRESDKEYEISFDGISGDGLLGLVVDTLIQDIAGNKLDAPFTSSSYTIDNTPPVATITINDRENGIGRYTNDDSISYSISFDEQIDASSLSAFANMVAFTPVFIGERSLEDQGDSVNLLAVLKNISGDGDLYITIQGIRDIAGNTMVQINSDTLVIDNTQPNLSISNDGDVFYGSGDSLRIEVIVQNNDRINAITLNDSLLINNSALTISDTLSLIDNAFVYSLSNVDENDSLLESIDKRIVINAYDSAGNITIDSSLILTFDKTPAMISQLNVEAEGNSLTMNMEATEVGKFFIYVTDTSVNTIAGDALIDSVRNGTSVIYGDSIEYNTANTTDAKGTSLASRSNYNVFVVHEDQAGNITNAELVGNVKTGGAEFEMLSQLKNYFRRKSPID